MDQSTHSSSPVDLDLDRHSLSVRTVTVDDIKDALMRGVDDFRAMPTHIVFLGIFYAVIGLVLIRVTLGRDLLQVAFPLIAGFALAGPFAALGTYELSRRREQGLDYGLWRMFGVVNSPAAGSITVLGLILTLIFCIWLWVATVLYTAFMGEPPDGLADFIGRLFGTAGGWGLIIFGNAIGAVFALFVFLISVVSFPLLLDRNVGLATAISTSIKAVIANPRTMTIWAGIIVAGLIIGSVPIFLGLALIFPILGHASWHMYKKVVPGGGQPAEPSAKASPE